jgi:hypothetical protein
MVGSLLEFLIYIAIIGVILWAIVTYVPMPQPFKAVIIVIGAIIALLLLLKAVQGSGLLSRHVPCSTIESISLPEYHCHGQSTA